MSVLHRVKNYLAQDNSDFEITFNLAQLLDATLQNSAHAIITRVPAKLATRQNYRALSLFATRVLIDSGLLVFVGTTDALPASSYLQEFEFVTSSRIIKTDENVFVFQKPCKWFGTQKRQINASGFKDYQGLITGLTRRGELILDPFKNELTIGQIATELGRIFISSNCAACSTKDMLASIEVRS